MLNVAVALAPLMALMLTQNRAPRARGCQNIAPLPTPSRSRGVAGANVVVVFATFSVVLAMIRSTGSGWNSSAIAQPPVLRGLSRPRPHDGHLLVPLHRRRHAEGHPPRSRAAFPAAQAGHVNRDQPLRHVPLIAAEVVQRQASCSAASTA